jgi:hypothetical protein
MLRLRPMMLLAAVLLVAAGFLIVRPILAQAEASATPPRMVNNDGKTAELIAAFPARVSIYMTAGKSSEINVKVIGCKTIAGIDYVVIQNGMGSTCYINLSQIIMISPGQCPPPPPPPPPRTGLGKRMAFSRTLSNPGLNSWVFLCARRLAFSGSRRATSVAPQPLRPADSAPHGEQLFLNPCGET